MEVAEILDELMRKCKRDEGLRQRFLQTREAEHPLEAFCALSGELGYPMYVMDLATAGEQYYADMRRSTNGGGENSPLLEGEDDYYGMFFAELSHL